MYEIQKGKVLFQGKKTKIDHQTFEELTEGFAKDCSAVYFQGRVQKNVDLKTFRCFDKDFVADQNSVYLVMSTKLKPIKADPESFQSLGYGYAQDASASYWRDKTLRGNSRVTPLGLDIALDDKGALWGNRRIVKKPLDPKTSHCHQGGNFAFVWDKSDVWFSSYQDEAHPLHVSHPENFQVLLDQYASDGNSLYFGDREIEDVKPEKILPLGNDHELVKVGQHIISSGMVLEGCDSESFGFVDHLMFDKASLFPSETAHSQGLDKDIDLETLVRDLVLDQIKILSRLHPIGNRPHDLDELPDMEFPDIELRFESDTISVLCQGREFKGTWGTIWELSSKIWSTVIYGQDFVRFLHETCTSYPNGDLQVERVLRRGGGDLLIAAGQASQKALNSLTRQIFTSIYFDEDKVTLLESVNYQALKANSFEKVHSQKTTNLARAKELLATEAHTSDSPMERHQCAMALYGLTVATNQYKHFLNQIAPPIYKQAQIEEEASIKLQWLSVLDIILASVFLDRDLGPNTLYAKAKNLTLYLLEERFNLDLNLARLWEIQEALGEDSGNTEQQLRALIGNKRMAPSWSGLHHDQPSLDAWFAIAKIRLLKLQSEENIKGQIPEFLSKLEEQIQSWKEPEPIANLLCDLEDITGDLTPYGRALSWPQDALYTRLSCVEYLINQMEYTLGDVQSDEDGFLIRGWPWGRQIEVTIGESTTTVSIGLKNPWPKGEPQKVDISL